MKKILKGEYLLIIITLLMARTVYGDISGQVYVDYNLNGQLDSTSTIRNMVDTVDIPVAVDHGVSDTQLVAECLTASGTTTSCRMPNS